MYTRFLNLFAKERIKNKINTLFKKKLFVKYAQSERQNTEKMFLLNKENLKLLISKQNFTD